MVICCGLGCTTPSPTRLSQIRSEQTANKPLIKMIQGDLKMAFDAAQRVMAVYDVKEARMDEESQSAILSSNFLVGDDHNTRLFEYPEPPLTHEPIRSAVTLRFRGGKYRGVASTKVEIEKSLQSRDNFKGWLTRESDGVEEQILMDQIEEEIFNVLAARRAQEKSSPKSKPAPDETPNPSSNEDSTSD